MAHNTSVRTPRGLTEFPLELLRSICNNLCTHCNPNTQIPSHLVGQRDSENRDALIALCATCKTFRHLAQPLLYHFLPHLPGVSGFPKLVRTLEERPDLSMQLKRVFREPFSSCGWDILEEEEVELIKSVARRLGMEREEDPEFEAAEENDASAGEFCFEVLIAMLPRLEALEMTVELETYSDETNFYFLHERSKKLGSAAASTYLKHLSFETANDWGISADIPAITALLNISPNLEHLELSGCFGAHSGRLFQDSVARPLRIVEMHGCALEDNDSSRYFIKDIIAHAPNLQQFYYRSRGPWIGENIGHHLSVPQFLNCLGPVKHSLTSLNIDLTDHSYDTGPRDVIERGSLFPFIHLKTLHIDHNSICCHQHEKEGAPNCLVDNIPPNLHALNLRLQKDTCIWGDLEKLGAVAERFPELKEVTVRVEAQIHDKAELENLRSTLYGHGRNLEKAFVKKNIAFKMYDQLGYLSDPIGPINFNEVSNHQPVG